MNTKRMHDAHDLLQIEASELMDELERCSSALHAHRVFGMVRHMEDLRTFMQWHVFAVWDFMSLVKRLQNDLTCVSVPWISPKYPGAARLINEIVLGEESDETPGHGHASHYDLYVDAMREVGADPAQMNRFLDSLISGQTVQSALRSSGASEAVIRFVSETIATAVHGATHEVLGSFFYGRENVIPKMFSSLLADWSIDEASVPVFVYYLKRHIELDGDAHGPAAEAIIREIVGENRQMRVELLKASISAVKARIALWDALAVLLSEKETVAA
jgi:hypothetical protein